MENTKVDEESQSFIVHVVQLPLDGLGRRHLDLVHGGLAGARLLGGRDAVLRVEDVGADHAERLRVAARLPLAAGVAGVGDAVVEARGFVGALELVVGVGEAVPVGGQPQPELVVRHRQLHRVLQPRQLEQRLARRRRGEGLLRGHRDAELHVVQVNVLLARVLRVHLRILQNVGNIPLDEKVDK